MSPGQGEYFALAGWSGENLPPGSIVTTRKPRTFFLMSGIKAQSIPLETDPDVFLVLRADVVSLPFDAFLLAFEVAPDTFAVVL